MDRFWPGQKAREQGLDICLFWHGPQLRPIDRICLASMLLVGQRVNLYCYRPPSGVPDGVTICDAREVVAEAMLSNVAEGRWNLPQFSDVFRVMLMKHGKGLWLDTDTYLAKPFSPDPSRHFLAWEDRRRCGVSALYFPPDSPIIREFDDYLASGEAVPPWLGFKRRVLRPWLLRLQGKTLDPIRIGWTVFGNDGITRLARKHDLLRDAWPKGTFYFWTGSASERVYRPEFGLEPLSDPDFIGFHFHRKGRESEQPPLPGSFFAWACERVEPILSQ